MYTEYIKKAAEYFYANDQPNRGSMMDDAAREVERLCKIEAAAKLWKKHIFAGGDSCKCYACDLAEALGETE